MSRIKYKAADKQFLSDASDEFGAICYHVEVNEDLFWKTINADLRIQDCYRSISLCFDASVEELDSRIEKANILVDKVIAFRDALEASRESAISLEAEKASEGEDKKDD